MPHELDSTITSSAVSIVSSLSSVSDIPKLVSSSSSLQLPTKSIKLFIVQCTEIAFENHKPEIRQLNFFLG